MRHSFHVMEELGAECDRLGVRVVDVHGASGSTSDFLATVARYIEAREKELHGRRWIPVTERLPPLMTEVLGWHPSDRVRAWFRHSGTVQGGPQEGTYWESWSPQDRECDDCDVDEPTYWMPLPAPPSDGK